MAKKREKGKSFPPQWQALWAERLIAWHRVAGRRTLPWHTRDPYRIWLSEVMLQQTQVPTVIPYYERFVATWPTVEALAAAPLEAVLAAWSGLGYYARARNLHRAAQQIVRAWGGTWPRDPDAWAQLPGVGRSTAAAICAFAFGTRAAILDGNVERVLVRLFGIATPLPDTAVKRQLWQIAEALLPESPTAMPEYTQAQMDLGALVCTRGIPNCAYCPVAQWCTAYAVGNAAALPQRKARAPVPEIDWTLRAYRCGTRYWWVPRPNQGIWGGLWALPHADEPPPPGSWQRASSEALPAHRLTHRRLRITIEEWTTPAHLCYDCQSSTQGRWATAREALAWGLPRPLAAWAETRAVS